MAERAAIQRHLTYDDSAAVEADSQPWANELVEDAENNVADLEVDVQTRSCSFARASVDQHVVEYVVEYAAEAVDAEGTRWAADCIADSWLSAVAVGHSS